MAQPLHRVCTQNEPERAILVGIETQASSWPLDDSLDELERLAHTAGARVVYRLSQRLERANAKTFIGSGKVLELAQAVENTEAELVVFDEELTPSQQANLEKALGSHVKVLDRTALILDIFALHATSKEGRLQVRLAQNQYLYPRLRGMWSHLASNRMGGGVGSRFGEGESQLEVDRRLVRKRITRLQRELAELDTQRKTQRKARDGSAVFRIALAGYTNAGKSSLLNALTGADAYVHDQLFATLDSKTRQLVLPNGAVCTLTDTVGFIQKLPHTLVQAFRSTLDEILEADLVLLVVDATSPQRDAHLAAVRDVLGEIGASEIPRLTVYNKLDALPEEERLALKRVPEEHVLVSAHTQEGFDMLLAAIERQVMDTYESVCVLIPYEQGMLVERAHNECVIVESRYEPTGTWLNMHVPKRLTTMFSAYRV